MPAYYNENNSFAAAWLRELIKRNLIAPGDVDERSIVDVKPHDLRKYTQCHFFAGIGGWSYALRLAGWPDDRPVWTGSCPCQPFSAAGKRKGTSDERHLWPAFFHLIQESKPVNIFGEQVASKDGLAWLDLVSSNLEGAGYTIGAVDTCAAGLGAPHIRQRFYWVADSRYEPEWGLPEQIEPCDTAHRSGSRVASKRSSASIALGNPGVERAGRDSRTTSSSQGGVQSARHSDGHFGSDSSIASGTNGVTQGDANDAGPQRRELSGTTESGDSSGERTVGPPSFVNGFWSPANWLPCIDGKSRPVEPGTFPLAHGIPGRVGRLRGYGNAIVPQVAQAFIESYMEITQGETCVFAD